MSVSVCLAVCLSVREHISGTTRPIFNFFVHVTYGRGWVLFWQHCYMLCISGLWMMSYFHNKPYSGMSLKRVMSLRRRAQPNAPAASYWLRRVLDDGGRRDWDESIVQAVRGGRSLLCATALLWLGFRDIGDGDFRRGGGGKRGGKRPTLFSLGAGRRVGY